jgi:hypothetical protein
MPEASIAWVHIPFDRLDEIRDQIVAPFKLDVNLGPGAVHADLDRYQLIVIRKKPHQRYDDETQQNQ